MDDPVIPSLNRIATIETVVPDTRTRPAAPVHLPAPVVYSAPPAVEQPAQPPGDLPMAQAAPAISLFTVPNPVQTNNLAPDISTFSSSNEPYFQLAGTASAPDTWYQFPSESGSVLFDNTIPLGPLPVQFGTLHAFGQEITYQNQSLMPSTWYLNPALNGEILLVDASGTQLLHSIGADLFYNNELLAKANDIQDIADWSLYPALQSVDFNNNGITNASDVASATATIGTVNAGSVDASGAITAGATGTFGSVSTAGAVSAASISTTGAGTFGSVGTTGSGTFGSITSNGNIDASGNQVQNASAITIGPGPFGTLSSPDGTVLTFNGNAITTGTEGDAANWANFPAINTVTGLSTTPLTITPGANQPLNITAPTTAINSNTGGSYNVTVDKGINVVAAANVDITAQNGSGGNIALNAQPGYQLGNQQVGFGAIQLNAFGSSNQILGLGGKIDINAFSGGLGEYGSATSRVSVSSATIALSAGAAPTLPGTAGAMNIFGQDIVSIVASVIPPILPQFPQTVYIYGEGIPFTAGGVRLSSPNGVQIADNSELYATDIFPFTSNGLNLKGRASIPGPAADVTIEDCASIDMRNAGTITGVQSLTMAGTGVISGVQNIVADGGNLTIQGAGLITPNLVSLANVNTVAFEPAVSGGTGAITGVQTINGVAYPPPSGDSSDWATFPAVQAVDMSGNGITNLPSITSTASLSITAATQVTVDTGIIDVVGADIQNVSNITNHTSNLLTVQSTVNLTVSAETALTLVSDSADVTVQGQTGITVYAATGNVNITADSGEVVVQDSALNMNSHKITNLSPGTVGTDAVNFTQLTFRDSTEFFVSSQGSNSNNGSFLSPFLTIQAAITAAELISSAANIVVISVASGNYIESLSFQKGYVVLNGSLQSQTGNEVCEITGSISIACVGANDVFNRQVTFQGFNLTCGAGQSITNTSSSSHTVSFQDCKIFVDGIFYNSTATAPDMRTFITNAEITSTNAANVATVITTNVGLVEIERLDLTVSGNAIGIAIAGTSVLNRLSLAALDNTNAAVILKPLLNVTSSTLSAHSLGNVAFAFTSSVAKTNTNAMAIASSVNSNFIMLNCVFTLAGTGGSTNNCIGYNGVGSPSIAGVNNTSLSVNVLLPQTVTVQSGITQIQYTNIQPPGLATYSSTADQVIAASGVPQALTFNTTQFNQGTTLLLNSRVYANAQGNYNLNHSVEIQHTGGGSSQIVTTFLKKNGTTIANTGRQWTVGSGSSQFAAMAEHTVSLNAGDYVEVFFSGDTSISANATAAAGALPAVPSVVFNIKQFR